MVESGRTNSCGRLWGRIDAFPLTIPLELVASPRVPRELAGCRHALRIESKYAAILLSRLAALGTPSGLIVYYALAAKLEAKASANRA